MSERPQGTFSPSPPPSMGGGAGWSNSGDPHWFLDLCRELVCDNYNETRQEGTPELLIDEVYVIWFATVLKHWKATVSSNVVKGMMWVVSYNERRDEAYTEVYRRMFNVVKKGARNS